MTRVEVPVTATVVECDGVPRGMSIIVKLLYDSTDPFVARIEFAPSPDDPGEPIVWEVARDLLAGGLVGDAGAGDFRMRRSGLRSVEVRLISDDGTALYEFPRHPVAKFVRRVSVLVPWGAERSVVDVDAALDAAIDRILSDGVR